MKLFSIFALLLLVQTCLGQAAAPKFTPVPLGKLCNRELVDPTPEGDGKGGWTDQGPDNSLSGFPTGKAEFAGIPFEIPATGPAALMFSGKTLAAKLPSLPAEVTIKIPNGVRTHNLYLLLTAVWGGSADEKAAAVEVTYQNGQTETLELRYGKHLGGWWAPKATDKAIVAWTGKNGRGVDVGVYLTPFKLKNAAAPVIAVAVRANTAAAPSLALLGVTLGDRAPEDILPAPARWLPWDGNGMDGWWPIETAYDKGLTPAPWEDAFTFFRQPAGSLGWTRAAGENLEFEKAPGVPVRFHGACGCGPAFYPPKALAERYAKVMRKYGFNQIRLHSLFDELLQKDGQYTLPEYNETRLDKFDYLVAELKKAGLYVNPSGLFSMRWAAATGVAAYDRIQPLNNTQYYFDPKHQELYLQVLRKFLEHRNPYTGLRYCEEPAFNMYKLINESSLFFNTVDGSPGPYRIMLQDRYNEWLKAKYESDGKLAAVWSVPGQGSPLSSVESLGKGTVALLGIGDLATGSAAQRRRSADQTLFYYQLETAWFKRVESLFRSLGSKTLLQGSSWGGPRHLQEIQSAANATLDFTGKHTYWLHPSGGWSMSEALFGNEPVERHPGEHLLLPAFQHVSGKPFAITEWQFAAPNDYVNNAPIFFAAYGAMQNIAANHRFVFGQPEFASQLSDFFNMFSMPGSMALEPVAYFLYVRGDVQTAPVLYRNPLPPARLHDPERSKGVQGRESGNRFFMAYDGQTVPETAMLVGGVRLGLSEGETRSVVWDETVYRRGIDEKAQTITASTGELVWHYGDAYIDIKTPKTRGLMGFFGNRSGANGPLAYKLNNAYGAFTFSALDNVPLEQSGRLYVTLVGRVRNSGESFDVLTQAGQPVKDQPPFRVGQRGGPPLRMEPATLEFSLNTNRNGAWTLQALDAAGAPLAGTARTCTAANGKLTGKINGAELKSFCFVLTAP